MHRAQQLWMAAISGDQTYAQFACQDQFFRLINSSIIHRMSIKTQLNESMKEAMKSGDEVRKRTIRMVLAAIKQVEVDKRTELDDAAMMSLLQKEIKNRREALEEARKADRADLVQANEAEIEVLQAFLPKAMPAGELRALVQAAIAETGASSPADMGKVMKVVMPKVAGRAPNDAISATVREFLQK
ncbi:MAG TPA: GatB/YqeY domain-containing protein [Anaerolineales bacterium]